LWENKYDEIRYLAEDGKMYRIPTVGEREEIYGQDGK